MLSPRRQFLLLCLIAPLAMARADVLVRTFETGSDSLTGDDAWGNDSTKVVLSLDSSTTLSGKASSRLDYVLSPKTTKYPWAGASSWFGGTYDLRKATGIRIKLRSLVANTKIYLQVNSNWYPLPHINRDVMWQWDFPLPLGELDTTLYFSNVTLFPSAATIEPNLTSTIPRLQDILQGVNGISFNIHSSNEPFATSLPLSGAILWDDISVVGTDALLPGSDPKSLVLRDYTDSAMASHPDSVLNTWRFGNSKSTAVVRRNRFQPAWDSVDIRCNFTLANDPANPYSAYAGCGLGFHADSAGDLRGTTRWEFAQNVPHDMNMWIALVSSSYPQILVDSGVIHGWNAPFDSSYRWWEGAVLYTDSLKPPSWASGRTRLLAMLPSVDSVLKGVIGINFQVKPDFLSDASVSPASASGFFQVNHFLAIGVDHWIPSPNARGSTTSNTSRQSPSKAWDLSGRKLSNKCAAGLDLFSPDGHFLARIPPGNGRSLNTGVYLVRNDSSPTQVIAVP
jgi:hypothetical protein